MAAASPTAPRPPEPASGEAPVLDVAALRAHFPALKEGAAHFDGPGGSQTPDVVAGAVADALTGAIANVGTVTRAEQRATRIVADARAALADFLGADPRGIVVGRSFTQITYDISRALAKTWQPGDEVVVTRLDHDSDIRPWVQAAATADATVRWVDFDPATGELTVDDVRAQLSDRTRLVAVTAASNLIGTRPPIADITAATHEVGALAYVDGVHYTAHVAVDMAELGADFFGCSPYKFLGPHCGVVAARPEVLDTLHPDKLLPSPETIPERFELGTLPYELMAGTTAAIDLIAGLGGDDRGDATRRDRVLAGMRAVEAHEERLLVRLETAVRAMPGVRLHSNASRRTPTLLLTFENYDVQDVRIRLAERDINAPASHFYALECSRHLGLGDAGGLRIGLAPYTDDDDIDRLISALTEIV